MPFRIKKTDASKLQDEYAKLVEGLQEAQDEEDTFMTNPGISRRHNTVLFKLTGVEFCLRIC
jgi:hypothetical protein